MKLHVKDFFFITIIAKLIIQF